MNIQIFGQRELVEYIQNGGKINSHLVSIGNPGKGIRSQAEDASLPEIFKTSFQDILRLEFYDVEYKRHLGPMRPKRIPIKKDVRQAINFFNRTKDHATGYTIHCWRGISRSTAIALGYLFMIYGDEQKAAEELFKSRSEAGPHMGIVKYYDQILGSHLHEINKKIRDMRLEEMKKWFFEEIDNGDSLLEELEIIDD